MPIEEEILIVSVTPYFLEKGNFWFEENKEEIKKARKTQSFFEDNTLLIEKDQLIPFSNLLKKLDDMGYEKVQTISDPGEFSVQGGIAEIFPVNLNHAVRLDFLGNKIDSIERLSLEAEEEKSKKLLKKKLKSQKIFSDLKNLKPGDYLVHLDHGVGKYTGLSPEKKYVLEYAENDKLYIPLDKKRKLSRYVGFREPKLNRLSSPLWQKTKRKVKEEAEKIARDLLHIYAKREISLRTPYLAEDDFDLHLASGFPYKETPDQKEAIEDIKKDLEKETPMDRIVCGDVGFGKTETALRAAIKVAKSGFLTALISPTTILAEQHYQNFKKRIKNLPFKIALLSRLQTKKEQKEIARELEEEKIDIIIGTHRLLSDDIAPLLFKKRQGLLIIDDEQKFGVKQKEKLRKEKGGIDVLSLSATPIPRTLHLALSSLKNISLIQTSPEGRQPVKTFVKPYNKEIIKRALKEELKRGGQVYYLYNKVETIEKAKKTIEKIVPEARVAMVHGRMNEKKLIKTMKNLKKKKIDVLVTTTIIENGIDLPNVNTLIVADSIRLGLGQAYQIRGRVGRSHKKAKAYFLYSKNITDKAKKRLNFLKKMEEPGSGYRIALKDLEIRGAGNILGKEQSGSINQVGLNLYCQMVSQAVEKIKASS